MSETTKPFCPECADSFVAPEPIDRRNFIRVIGGSAVTLATAGTVLTATPGTASAIVLPGAVRAARTPHPAESLIRELNANLTPDQRRLVVRPWNAGADNGGQAIPMRHRMYNNPMGRRIGEVYTRPQQELNQRILRALAGDEDGYQQLTRGGTFDASQSFGACGADLFGSMEEGQQWAWVFTGHHITVRCDGNTEPNTAFGGPIYYGHSPDGYSQRNIFNYQTRSVMSLFDALSAQQRARAVVVGTPGEGAPSIRFRQAGQPRPGIPASDLTLAQKQLARVVMRTLLQPYRREDGDEVMEILGRNGGLDSIHFAFYREPAQNDNARWHFWRLEGPGFVWNFRVLPHVHTFVNIAVPT
jgi:hypothetical protein